MKITIHDHTPDGTSTRTSDGRRSGSVNVVGSTELDLGREGWGEVEFIVAVSFQLETNFRSVKSIDWQDNDDVSVPRNKAPYTAIEQAVVRYIERNSKTYLEQALSKLR